jgi:hypothetical protein
LNWSAKEFYWRLARSLSYHVGYHCEANTESVIYAKRDRQGRMHIWSGIIALTSLSMEAFLLFRLYRRMAKEYLKCDTKRKVLNHIFLLGSCILLALLLDERIAQLLWFSSEPAERMHILSEIIALCILGIGVLSFFWLYQRMVEKYNKDDEKRKVISQTFVLGSCILAALFLDEKLIRLLWLSSGFEGLYRMTFAVKWEIAAILATGIITVQYWLDYRRKMDKIEGPWLWSALTASGAAILFLGLSIDFLYQMLLADSSTSLLHDFSWHFFFLFLMSCCFLTADYLIWRGVILPKDPKYVLKNLSHLSIWLLDFPTAFAFLLLGLFCGIHLAEHSYFHFVHGYLWPAPPPIDHVNLWTSEEYFMSGAIAFQYLLSTTIYLILAFGRVKIEMGKIETQHKEVRIESPA